MIIEKFLEGKKGSMKVTNTPHVFTDKNKDSYIIAITGDSIDVENKVVIGGGLEFIRGTKAQLQSITPGFIYNRA